MTCCSCSFSVEEIAKTWKYYRVKILESMEQRYTGCLHTFMPTALRWSPLSCKFLSFKASEQFRGSEEFVSPLLNRKSTNYRESIALMEHLMGTLRLLVTVDVATSWLAVETSDVPYILKLASVDLTSWAAGDTVSQRESGWTVGLDKIRNLKTPA